MANSNGRLLSLDALRGFDMMFIMGLSAVIAEACGIFREARIAGWLSR